MAILYRHLKPDGENFYIGIGNSVKRAYSKSGRSKFWRDTVNKHGYEIQILKTDLTWEEAAELEIMLISYYGRRDLNLGTLVNLTDGGDGQSNPSKESRLKMRGNKMNVLGSDHYFYGKTKTVEHRKKLSEAKLGVKQSNTHIEQRFLTIKSNMAKNIKAKKVINLDTLKIYNSIGECQEDLGIKNLRDYLNPKRTSLPNKYPVMFLEDYDKGVSFKPHTPLKRPIVVLNTITGTLYNTIVEAAKKENIGEATLRRNFKKLDNYKHLKIIND